MKQLSFYILLPLIISVSLPVFAEDEKILSKGQRKETLAFKGSKVFFEDYVTQPLFEINLNEKKIHTVIFVRKISSNFTSGWPVFEVTELINALETYLMVKETISKKGIGGTYDYINGEIKIKFTSENSGILNPPYTSILGRPLGEEWITEDFEADKLKKFIEELKQGKTEGIKKGVELEKKFFN